MLRRGPFACLCECVRVSVSVCLSVCLYVRFVDVCEKMFVMVWPCLQASSCSLVTDVPWKFDF
jgi:formate/nitrite transporter FocA (FNT family)